MDLKARENRVRKAAAAQELVVVKSRSRSLGGGPYRLEPEPTTHAQARYRGLKLAFKSYLLDELEEKFGITDTEDVD